MAALNCGMKCVKYLLFIFNFIFWLAGTGVMAVGLWLRFDKRVAALVDEQASTAFYIGVYILIAAGALVMVVGFLGCCGAITESPCMLGLFFLFLLLIFAVEVAAGVLGSSAKERVVKEVTAFYKQTYNDYEDTKQEELKKTLHLIHFGLNCCGLTGMVNDTAEDICPKKEGILVTTSCPAAIEKFINGKLYIIVGVAIGMAVILIFGMVFSILLCCTVIRTRDI